MKASEISSVIRPVEAFLRRPDDPILHLLTDSRTLVSPHGTLFFAIPTKRNSGCRYIDGLYQAGVRQFVVPADCDLDLPEANIWRVDDVLAALQRLAAHHRAQFSYPVVGITGSNGKTIVKDWIVQLLSPDRRLVSSPKSYNSQIGVPLSVWQMEAGHEMAVFEAGISETGEMARLQKIIQPTIGIFTNVGQAHDENFLTRQQKVAEKLQLFTHCEVLIYSTDHKDIHSVLSDIESFRHINRFTWGTSADNAVRLLSATVGDRSTTLSIAHADDTFSVVIPFVDRASQQNVMHCITLMLYLGYSPADITARCAKLTPVEMRLEMNEGINNCLLINDSYSLDLNSLSIALDFLQHEHQHFNKTLIISDFLQTGVPDSELYTQVAQLIAQRGITRLIGVGPALCHNKSCFADVEALFYPSTEQMLHDCDFNLFQNEAILLKGARMFGFEKVAKLLQRKSHETIMEVNLDAMIHNLNFYRSRINPGTKLMAMVKASSYGAGKVEVASALQFNHVDYLTVAYADEGVELRRNGIHLPIMVMNPEEASFDDIMKYRLEPDIYSFRILDLFSQRVRLHGERMAIHVEFDTGMHRLGFSGDDIDALAARLNELTDTLEVRSIFSHLACSEDPDMDDFTHSQIDKFRIWSDRLDKAIHHSHKIPAPHPQLLGHHPFPRGADGHGAPRHRPLRHRPRARRAGPVAAGVAPGDAHFANQGHPRRRLRGLQPPLDCRAPLAHRHRAHRLCRRPQPPPRLRPRPCQHPRPRGTHHRQHLHGHVLRRRHRHRLRRGRPRRALRRGRPAAAQRRRRRHHPLRDAHRRLAPRQARLLPGVR